MIDRFYQSTYIGKGASAMEIPSVFDNQNMIPNTIWLPDRYLHNAFKKLEDKSYNFLKIRDKICSPGEVVDFYIIDDLNHTTKDLNVVCSKGSPIIQLQCSSTGKLEKLIGILGLPLKSENIYEIFDCAI